jgi:hypothetical protein
MVKSPSLESTVAPLAIFTRAWVVGAFGTVQEYVPDDAPTPVAIVVHAPPGEVL